MNNKLEIGDRVTSSDVPQRDYGDKTYQDKQLEIVEFLDDDKVKCKYFPENKTNPEIEHFEVSLNSIEFINKQGLDYKDSSKDPFWDSRYKKGC